MNTNSTLLLLTYRNEKQKCYSVIIRGTASLIYTFKRCSRSPAMDWVSPNPGSREYLPVSSTAVRWIAKQERTPWGASLRQTA